MFTNNMENEQINVIIENEGLSPAQFATAIGIQRAQVSHLQNNRNHVSLDVVKRIHAAFPNISVEWLLTGKGDYYVEGGGASSSRHDSIPSLVENMLFDDTESSLPVDVTPQPSENRKNTSVDKIAPVSCKENVSVKLQNAVQNADEQRVENEKKHLRNIIEIKVFYDDGTYETFFHR